MCPCRQKPERNLLTRKINLRNPKYIKKATREKAKRAGFQEAERAQEDVTSEILRNKDNIY